MSKVHLHGAGHGPGHHHAGDDEDDADAHGGAGADGGADAYGGGGEDAPPGRRGRSWARRLELIITVLLGLTAVVGAFAALKNEQRNHDATFEFSEGIKNFDDSGQFYATGNATFTHDQTLF